MCCNCKDLANVGYTYKHNGLGHKSFIDHVYVSNFIESNVTDLIISEHGFNLSDHNAIFSNFHVSNMVKVNTAAQKTTVDEQHYIRCNETSKTHYYELTDLLFHERSLLDVNF